MKTDKQKTLKNFLSVAFEPVGSTMYVWGGGWNTNNTSAGDGAMHIGTCPIWREFFLCQNSDYNFKDYLMLNNCGLDCSGYVGWVMYNYINRFSVDNDYITNKDCGFVFKACDQAKKFSDMGFGSFVYASEVTDVRCGDIMSSSSHVYIVVGEYNDGSVLLLHSSPPGVQLCGTYSKDGNRFSNAVFAAREYTQKNHPVWYKKYGTCIKDTSYLSGYSRFRFDTENTRIMTDPDDFQTKSPNSILTELQ